MDIRFTYRVVPKRPIRNLIKGKLVSRPEILSLTKEEVLYCIKHGSVYRKFYGETKMERVLPSNIDRLHRRDHISEKEYNTLINSSHHAPSGFFDDKDSEVANSTVEECEKKPTLQEDQFSSNDNKVEESVSSEPDTGSDQELCDDDIIDNEVEESVSSEPENVESIQEYEMPDCDDLEGEEEFEESDVNGAPVDDNTTQIQDNTSNNSNGNGMRKKKET